MRGDVLCVLTPLNRDQGHRLDAAIRYALLLGVITNTDEAMQSL